jgi:hypothetical protein
VRHAWHGCNGAVRAKVTVKALEVYSIKTPAIDDKSFIA